MCFCGYPTKGSGDIIMAKTKKVSEEWIEEMENFPTDLPNSEYVEDPEEELEFRNYKKQFKKKRKFKWKPKGKILAFLGLLLLEFLFLVSICLFLVPLAINYYLDPINSLCIGLVLMIGKRWAKN